MSISNSFDSFMPAVPSGVKTSLLSTFIAAIVMPTANQAMVVSTFED